MRLYFLGICGTFMASLALLAKELGHDVTGCDANIYPPMSDVLTENQVNLDEGYEAAYIDQFRPDLVIIGNVLSRGNPAVEAVLNQRIPFTSGPLFLREYILPDRHVIAVAGTHGKTTTASLVAWLLAHAGKQPGFLIGGVPKNFNKSAALGNPDYFVVEADEYDTAFFDKRPKFMHYRPQTCVINNIEFDHGDIYADIDAIKTQFGYLLRTIPNNGLLIAPSSDAHVQEVIAGGCWTPVQYIAGDEALWRAEPLANDCHRFLIYHASDVLAEITWNQYGRHNMLNALAAFVACYHFGVSVSQLQAGLATFQGVKRRLEVRGSVNGITVYDDFAHHPTAIAATLSAMKAKADGGRVFAITEFGSNAMKAGMHQQALPEAFAAADRVYVYKPDSIQWNVDVMLAGLQQPHYQSHDINDLVSEVIKDAQQGDHLLVMSNKSFAGIHDKLLAALKT